MKKYSVELSKKAGETCFDASNTGGYNLSLNGLCKEDVGKGISPMEMMLTAAGGCAGIDVLSMLKDEADSINRLDVKVNGYRDPNEVPAYFRKVEIAFEIDGEVSSEKIIRCIELSLEKYCTVGKTLEAFADVSWTLVMNGEVITSETAQETL